MFPWVIDYSSISTHYPPWVGLTAYSCPFSLLMHSCLCSSMFTMEKSWAVQVFAVTTAEWDHPENSRGTAFEPCPLLSGRSGKYPYLMMNRRISHPLQPAILGKAGKLVRLVLSFLNGLLFDVMQTHSMRIAQYWFCSLWIMWIDLSVSVHIY